MIEMRVWLGFGAIIIFALVFAKKGVNPALAPICAICSTSIYFSVLGCFKLLVFAGYSYYILAIAALFWLLYSAFVKKQKIMNFSFGFWFFVFCGAAMILVLQLKQPMFIGWDEFSFWGTASKLTKIYNEFYTTAPVGWGWQATYAPVLTSLTYAVQFFGKGFLEWQTYAAYDLLLVACIGAMLASFKKRHWNIALPIGIIGFLTPFMFTIYKTPVAVAPAYLDTLADVPMGFLFGTALVCYFASDEKKWVANALPVLLVTAMLSVVKDTGFALALVVCVLILIDLMVKKRGEQETKSAKIKRVLISFGLCIASASLPFFGWSKYLSIIRNANGASSGGASSLSPFGMLGSFVKEIFSPNKSEKFVEVFSGMPRLFMDPKIRVSIFGNGLIVVLLVLAIIGFAAGITKTEGLRKRLVVFGIFSMLGFLAYSFLISLTYIYIFKEYQTFTSYERYMRPYYIGIFIAAVVLLGIASKQSKFAVEGKVAIILICLAFCLRFVQVVPIKYSFLGFDKQEFEERRVSSAQGAAISRKLPKDSLTFFVSQNDTGVRWFTYCYEFLPKQIDFSFGGGRIAVPGAMPDGTMYYYPKTLEELRGYLLKKKITHVFLEDADEMFHTAYGSLFEDDMQGYFEKGISLYELTQKGEKIILVPLA